MIFTIMTITGFGCTRMTHGVLSNAPSGELSLGLMPSMIHIGDVYQIQSFNYPTNNIPYWTFLTRLSPSLITFPGHNGLMKLWQSPITVLYQSVLIVLKIGLRETHRLSHRSLQETWEVTQFRRNSPQHIYWYQKPSMSVLYMPERMYASLKTCLTIAVLTRDKDEMRPIMTVLAHDE